MIAPVALCVASGEARAGYIQIKDTAGIFTARTAQVIHDHASRLPFDVRVVTSGTLGSRNAFDRFMNDQVASPTMVVVGIDPAQRRTSVHYGRAVGIPEGAYKAIEEAGSPGFRAGDFAGGVVAILDHAAKVASPSKAASPSDAQVEEPLSLRYGFGAFVLFVTAVVAYLLVALGRRPRERA